MMATESKQQQAQQYQMQLGGGGPLFDRNQEATVYVGNLDSRMTEDLVWELFLQCGPIVNVHIPRDKITNEHQGYGFVEFKNEEDADYAIKIVHMVKLFGKPVKVNKATQDKRTQEVGANVFVGNIHEDVDEKMLRDVFSSFGIVLSTKVMRDPETSQSKRYGFVTYDNFESSDAAITAMNGQFLCGKPIDVSYAYKKDTHTGERHGSTAERVLAYSKPGGAPVSKAPLPNAKMPPPPPMAPPPPVRQPPPPAFPPQQPPAFFGGQPYG